jgi:two-component system, OmpR family, response regulator
MGSEGERILVVDDEPFITDLLSAALRFEGFSVDVASTGAEALAKTRTERPDLVMLDIMLPDLEGVEVCRRIREGGDHVPVVFLTARDATEDKVSGLALGDDYVTKPFSLDELVARVRAVLRRAGHDGAGVELTFADLVMNVDTHEVWRQGHPIELTATEFNLLQYLLENVRRVVSKSEILDRVWGYDFSGDVNIVETYISYLRKKVDEYDPPLIHTVRRVGYSLRLPRE